MMGQSGQTERLLCRKIRVISQFACDKRHLQHIATTDVDIDEQQFVLDSRGYLYELFRVAYCFRKLTKLEQTQHTHPIQRRRQFALAECILMIIE